MKDDKKLCDNEFTLIDPDGAYPLGYGEIQPGETIGGDFVSELVDQTFRMNPDTEDMIPDARHLKDGMVVLLEDASEYAVIHYRYKMFFDQWPKAMVVNRWCTVSEIRMSQVKRAVYFTGTYSDGSKNRREAPMDAAWYVKLDSMEPPVDKNAATPELIESTAIVIETAIAAVDLHDQNFPRRLLSSRYAMQILALLGYK